MSSLLERRILTVAPSGLSLVQDIVNTRGVEGKLDDLLDAVGPAGEWLLLALEAWGVNRSQPVPSIQVRASEIAELRELRAELVGVMQGTAVAGVAPLEVGVSASGEAQLRPVGTGIAWLRSAAYTEIVRAQASDIWKRFKLCANPMCLSAFYDRSRNNSGVWHNVRTCGNAANLRASRARRAAPTPT
jgi:predicted RNA-binding Zn ribbon-like protein